MTTSFKGFDPNHQPEEENQLSRDDSKLTPLQEAKQLENNKDATEKDAIAPAVVPQEPVEQPWDIISHLEPKHAKEIIEGSGIDPEIAALNYESVSGQEVYELLLQHCDLGRNGSNYVRADVKKLLDKYETVTKGGFLCKGIDVLNFGESEWFQIKPNFPRIDASKNKPIKYEPPQKADTEILAHKVPARIWELIARRYNKPLPENYQSLPHGEFWKWVINYSLPVIICEGSKKAACLLSHGYVAIALPGVKNGYRTPKDENGRKGKSYLIPQLIPFATLGRQIIICFDCDTKQKTKREVGQAALKLGKLFGQRGCIVEVASWHPGLGKGIDDFFVANGEQALHEVLAASESLKDWETRQYKALTYPVGIEMDRRYLWNDDNPLDSQPPKEAQVIGIKSAKNTGKTRWLINVLKPSIQAKQTKVLLLSHRIQLALQTCGELGLPYVTKASIEELKQSMALCVDSLHPKSQAAFDPDEWRGATLIIDEVQQVIWHLLNSSTCLQERVIIFKNFKKLLNNIINHGGKIYLADADLNDIGLAFILELIDTHIEPFIIQNNYRFQQPWDVYCFQDKNPNRMIKLLEKRLCKGEKHMVCTSAQKPKSRFGTSNLEDYFKNKYPELKILRIDSTTVCDKHHPAYGCTSNLNEVVKNYDLVICSPTIETGISIEQEHFDGIWGIFQGVQTVDSVRQHLSRYRVPVPRYIFIAPQGLQKVGNGSTNSTGLLCGENRKNSANIKHLCDIGFTESLEGKLENIYLQTWAKMGALINLGNVKYRKNVISGLQEEGHNIIEVNNTNDPFEDTPTQEETDELKRDIRDNRDDIYLQERIDKVKAVRLTENELQTLSRQPERTREEQLSVSISKLEKTYSITIDNESFIKKHDEGWYPQIKLDYYFSPAGREFLKQKDFDSMASAIRAGGGDYFIPDTNQNLLNLEIRMLDWLRVKELLEGTNYHDGHELIVDIFNKVKKKENLWKIKDYLGIDFSKEESPIKACQRILQKIGYKMPFLYKLGSRDNQVRYYGKPAHGFQKDPENPNGRKLLLDANKQAMPIWDQRDEVFEMWLIRDEEERRKVEELAQQKAKQEERANAVSELEKCQTLNDYETAIAFYGQALIDEVWFMVSQTAQHRIRSFYAKPEPIQTEINFSQPDEIDWELPVKNQTQSTSIEAETVIGSAWDLADVLEKCSSDSEIMELLKKYDHFVHSSEEYTVKDFTSIHLQKRIDALMAA